MSPRPAEGCRGTEPAASGIRPAVAARRCFPAGLAPRGHHGLLAVLAPATAKGLWTRLNSHASGRRSGDQFNIYICDRFIVPALTSGQQDDIGAGRLLLDQMTRSFIREHLSYRFVVHQDGAQALAVERAVRAGSLPAGRPYLNPL